MTDEDLGWIGARPRTTGMYLYQRNLLSPTELFHVTEDEDGLFVWAEREKVRIEHVLPAFWMGPLLTLAEARGV